MSATPETSASTGILPALCAASACSGMPRALHRPAIAATSVSTPVSLFACISETSAVSGRSASATCSGSIVPSGRGRSHVTSKPSRSSCLQASTPARCSTREVTTCRRAAPAARAAPRIARFTLSVAPEVKTIDSPGALTRAADLGPRERDARGRASSGRVGGGRVRLQTTDRRGTRTSRRRREHRVASSRHGRGRSSAPARIGSFRRRQPALDRGQPAAQDADLASVRPGARNEPPNARTELSRVTVVREARGSHHALEMRIEGTPLVGSRRQRRPRPRPERTRRASIRTS